MISEKLTIKNFGPISNVDIDIKKIHIMVGPHSSGKTLVSLIIKYFRMIFRLTFTELKLGDLKNTKSEIEDFLTLQFKEIVRLDYLSFPNKATINYGISNGNKANFKITFGAKKITFEDDFLTFINDLIAIQKEIPDLRSAIEGMKIDDIDKFIYEFILGQKEKFFYDNHKMQDKKVIYIPAARTLSFLMRDHLKGRTADIPDYLINYYHMFSDAKIRLSSNDDLNENEGKFKKVIEEHLGGSLESKNISSEQEIIFKNQNNKDIQLKYLSSGQQESLPIYALLFNTLNNIDKNNYLFVIEEPEANLHPKGQADIVEFIAKFSNINKDNDFIITTHSPFVVDSFNNYILANEVYNNKKITKSQKSRLSELIKEDDTLKLDDFSQYDLLGGKSKDIKNQVSRQLGKGSIKKENQKIIELFGNILDIGFDINE